MVITVQRINCSSNNTNLEAKMVLPFLGIVKVRYPHSSSTCKGNWFPVDKRQ